MTFRHIFCLVLLSLWSASNAFALCVVNDKANLRSGPSSKYKKTWQVHKYTPLQQIGNKGKWLRVKDVDGDIHWVFSSLVSSKIKCVTVKDNDGANVWSGPTSKSKKLNPSDSKIPKYASFKFIKADGKWYQLQDEQGTPFWIYAPNVWESWK